MKIYDCEQLSPEWQQIRLGKITASNFANILAKGSGKTRKGYMMKLVAEKLTGLPEASYSNSFMEWGGIETETQARAYYEALYDVSVKQVGFVELNEWVGCSPDGLVGEDGLIEIKCPKSTTHVSNILANKMQSTYNPQVQGQMWVTGHKWCDWISFDPRVKSRPFFMVRVKRDEKYIKVLEANTEQFIKEMKEIIAQLTKSEF